MAHVCLFPCLKETENIRCPGFGGGCGSVCLADVMIGFSEAM